MLLVVAITDLVTQSQHISLIKGFQDVITVPNCLEWTNFIAVLLFLLKMQIHDCDMPCVLYMVVKFPVINYELLIES